VYLEGLQVLPALQKNAKGKAKAQDGSEFEATSDEGSRVDMQAPSTPPNEHQFEESRDMSPTALMEQQCVVLRSILNSNVAACYVKLVRFSV
jgi:hypothetical protein